MSPKKSSFERLLTVSLPETLHRDLSDYSDRHDFANFSALIRYALEGFKPSKKQLPAPEKSRQISFRIPDELRERISRHSEQSGVSLGEWIRVALAHLPEKPAGYPKSERAAKAPAKAPAKASAKKGDTVSPSPKKSKASKKSRK